LKRDKIFPAGGGQKGGRKGFGFGQEALVRTANKTREGLRKEKERDQKQNTRIKADESGQMVERGNLGFCSRQGSCDKKTHKKKLYKKKRPKKETNEGKKRAEH